MKIEALTKEQEARFPEFIKRWTDIGLCTKPANRKEAEEGIKLTYKIAGLPEPKRIVWCGSPYSQGLTRALVLGLKRSEIKIGASVRDSVWDSVRDSVGDSVWASVRAYVSSFFSIKYKHDFSPAIRLWESGLVPSFDGTTWRLYGGAKVEVLYEWKPRKAREKNA